MSNEKETNPNSTKRSDNSSDEEISLRSQMPLQKPNLVTEESLGKGTINLNFRKSFRQRVRDGTRNLAGIFVRTESPETTYSNLDLTSSNTTITPPQLKVKKSLGKVLNRFKMKIIPSDEEHFGSTEKEGGKTCEPYDNISSTSSPKTSTCKSASENILRPLQRESISASCSGNQETSSSGQNAIRKTADTSSARTVSSGQSRSSRVSGHSGRSISEYIVCPQCRFGRIIPLPLESDNARRMSQNEIKELKLPNPKYGPEGGNESKSAIFEVCNFDAKNKLNFFHISTIRSSSIEVINRSFAAYSKVITQENNKLGFQEEILINIDISLNIDTRKKGFTAVSIENFRSAYVDALTKARRNLLTVPSSSTMEMAQPRLQSRRSRSLNRSFTSVFEKSSPAMLSEHRGKTGRSNISLRSLSYSPDSARMTEKFPKKGTKDQIKSSKKLKERQQQETIKTSRGFIKKEKKNESCESSLPTESEPSADGEENVIESFSLNEK